MDVLLVLILIACTFSPLLVLPWQRLFRKNVPPVSFAAGAWSIHRRERTYHPVSRQHRSHGFPRKQLSQLFTHRPRLGDTRRHSA